MGSCVSGDHVLQKNYKKNKPMPKLKPIHEEKAATSNPIRLQSGSTFVPVNWVNGKYSDNYPTWLIDDLSPKKWSYIIKRLNKLNKRSNFWNPRQIKHYRELKKSNASKAAHLMDKDRKILQRDLDYLLADINHKILNDRALNAISVLHLNDNDDIKENIEPYIHQETKAEISRQKMGIIIQYVLNNNGQKAEPKSNIDDSEGKFIILSCYKKENYVNMNDNDKLIEMDETQSSQFAFPNPKNDVN